MHVRVRVDARLQSVPGPAGSIHHDSSVELDVHLDLADPDEGETNATLERPGMLLAVNHEPPCGVISDDTVPGLAYRTAVAHHLRAAPS